MITEDDDLVQNNQENEVHGRSIGFLLRDLEQKVLFKILLFKLEQVLWSLDYLVNIIFGSILNNNFIIKIQIIIEAEKVHGTIIDQTRLITLIFEVVIFPLIDVLSMVLDIIVARFVTTSLRVERSLFNSIVNFILTFVVIIILVQTYIRHILHGPGSQVRHLNILLILFLLVFATGSCHSSFLKVIFSHSTSQDGNFIKLLLNILSVKLNSFKLEVVCVNLQILQGFFTHSNFLRFSVPADVLTFGASIPNERKLRLGLAHDTRDNRSCVDSDLNFKVFSTFQNDGFCIVRTFNGKVSHSNGVMSVQES